ncbi:MAG: hypothetical protein KBA28_15070 [Syntrophaceae bacterium]|nr:hypothetical protein [Syntrophaceae bacterium]
MSKRKKASILFLGKKNDAYVEKALSFCKSNFTDVSTYLAQWNDPLPEDIGSWGGDYIISYLSRWVVPEYLLKKAKIAAINFHPASPEYPGVGCNNFALYEGACEYGVTCHHMASFVDTGNIIAVEKFPIFSSDNVATLLSRTYDFQLVLFYRIIGLILRGENLPVSKEQWTRAPFTRKELNELGHMKLDMSKDEILRRIRATTFGEWKPVVRLHGLEFELKTETQD